MVEPTPLSSTHPYRTPPAPRDIDPARDRTDGDLAMVVVAVIVVVSATIRLLRPLLGDEAFGVEPTFAAVAALACLAVIARALFDRWRDGRAR